MKLSDALGREHRFEAPPRRIVSLVPSITETLFAFGLDETIVGATDYCVHPADRLGQVPRVGGTKGLRVEDVLALEPDLVIANREENRRAQIDRLDACGIRVFVTYARTLPEAVREIQALGRLTQCDSAADAIAREVSEVLKEVSDTPRLRVLGLIWKQPWMTFNRDTFAHDLVRSSGGENVFGCAESRYPRISETEIRNADPEIILLPTEPYAFCEAERQELLALDCRAAHTGRIHIVEGELLSWYGPRMPRALRTFSELFRG